MTQPTPDIWNILDRYGLPLTMLFVIILALAKFVWPLLLIQIEATRKVLLDQLENSQQRLSDTNAEFLKALERRDAIMEEGFRNLEAALQKSNRRQKTLKDKTPHK